MKVEVLYFGLIEEALGVTKESIPITTKTGLIDFKQILLKKYPLLNELAFQIAVNKKLTSNNPILEEGAEIALLPPFAGG